jgi:hypothetical protein
MPRHPVIFLLVLLLMLVSAACTTVVGAPTPEEAVRQNNVRFSPENAATFQVLGMREWEGRVVVLYSYFRAPNQMFGYGLGWKNTRRHMGGDERGGRR